MFPLESVLLPGLLLPLHVFEQRYRTMIRECLSGDGAFGVVLIERGREVGGGDVRLGVGTVAVIEEEAELGDGRYALVCRGTARLRVIEWLPDDPYPVADVEVADDEDVDADADRVVRSGRLSRAEESIRRAWGLLSELGADSPLDPAVPVGSFAGEPEGPAGAASEVWAWCALAPLGALDRARLLEPDHHDERLQLLCDLTDAVAADARGLLAGGGPLS
jgi:Lon protease-like protein